jgi:hypothetical protein
MGQTAVAGAATPRAARVSSPAALAAGAFLLLVVAAILPLNYAAHQLGGSIYPLAFAPSFGAVGVVVVLRQPGNSIGWLLLAIGLCVSASYDIETYAYLIYHLGHHALPFGRIAVLLAPCYYPGLALLPLPILLFPDGHLSSVGWRRALGIYLALAVVLMATIAWLDAPALYARHIQVDSSGEIRAIDYPAGWEAVVEHVATIAMVVACVASIGRQVFAFRRSTGVQYQQLKSLLAGAAVCAASLLLSVVLGALGGQVGQFLSNLAFLGVVALPIGIGVGILRYRLYEIDRLVSRTLSYAVVTALLVGLYFGLVALISDALPFSSPVAVAASTLAAAAVFNPLRQRVQKLVDRRFNRARYDAEATIAAFSASLRDAVDIDTTSGELLQAVDHSLAPAHASLWIRPRGVS